MPEERHVNPWLVALAVMFGPWVGTGPGAEERRTIAVVVIGGQSLSLALTLLMTPVVYTLMDDLAASEWGRRVLARVQPAWASLSDGLRRLDPRLPRKP